MREAAAAQEFERAAALRNRLAGRAPPDGAPVRDGRIGGHRRRAGHRHGGRLGQRAGAPGARRRAAGPPVVLPRRRRAPRTRRRCCCSSPTSTTRWRWPSRALVIVAQDSDAAADLEALLSDRRGQPRGGARRRARRQAQAGRAGDAQRALRPRPGPPPPRAGARAPARRAGRPPGAPRPAGAAGADRVLRHLEPRRDVRRRLDGGVRGRGAGQVATTAPSRCGTRAGPTTSPAWRRRCTRRFSRLRDPARTTPRSPRAPAWW